MIQIIYWLLRNLNNRFALRCITKLGNWVMPVYYKITPPHLTDVNSNVIVSLTTFPKRIGKVHLAIQSVLRQKVRPKAVQLYLSKVQFGETIETAKLPNQLLKLQKYGLKIVMVDGDLKSHKKYKYALSQFPENLIVTVDDDIIYNTDLIEELLKYKKDNCIAANYVHDIQYDENGKIKPYNEWPLGTDNTKQHSLGSGGGMMCKTSDFHRDATNETLFTALAPKADDLWLTVMAILGKSKIVYTGYSPKYLAISISNNETLYSTNISDNDNQIESIMTHYYEEYGIKCI